MCGVSKMPIYWRSSWIKAVCTSSGESETYALSEAVRIALYLRNVGQELNITVPETPTIQSDATAALGFASNTGTTGRLKHIDLREGWVQELRSNSTIKVKVDTAFNKSDQFTKIISVTDFQRLEDEMMPEIPNEGDDEVDESLPAASDLAMRGDADQ